VSGTVILFLFRERVDEMKGAKILGVGLLFAAVTLVGCGPEGGSRGTG
jgi:hypothetical protein